MVIFFTFLVRSQRNSGLKQHFWLFCETYVWKFPHHIERKHKDNEEVKYALEKPPKSLQRKQRLAVLMQKGDYKANIVSLQKFTADVLTVHDSKKCSSSDSVPCPYSFGFMRARGLHEHVMTCIMAKHTSTSKSNNAQLRILR